MGGLPEGFDQPRLVLERVFGAVDGFRTGEAAEVAGPAPEIDLQTVVLDFFVQIVETGSCGVERCADHPVHIRAWGESRECFVVHLGDEPPVAFLAVMVQDHDVSVVFPEIEHAGDECGDEWVEGYGFGVFLDGNDQFVGADDVDALREGLERVDGEIVFFPGNFS